MERRLDPVEVELGDGRQAVDDGVQVGRHGDDLLRVKANAGVFRDAPHIGLGKMLRHESRSFSGSGRAVAIGTPRFVKSTAP